MLNLRYFQEIRGAKAFRQIRGHSGGCNRDQFRAMAQDLLQQYFYVASGGQSRNFKPAWHCLNDGQGLPTDGTCGTENGNLLQIEMLQFIAGTSFLVHNLVCNSCDSRVASVVALGKRPDVSTLSA